MKKSIAIVTGGCGFIGSNLVDKLILANNTVFVIDNMSTGLESNLNSLAICLFDDITNYMSNERSFSRDRVNSSLNRLKKNLEKKSQTLEKWF